MGIRVVVVDDNPHVRWAGRVHPVNATFHRFLAAVLDLPGAPVSSIVHCVPLRDAIAEPATLPLDPRIEVVGTAPFEGIEGYVRHLPAMTRRNRPILRDAIAGADLVWIKVPASNAPLAGWLAWRAGVPRFGYVAGTALAVARGRRLGALRQAVGFGYDLLGRAAGGRARVVVGQDIAAGRGIVTTLVEAGEIRERAGEPWPAIPWRLRLAWAGRLAPGKGLEELLDGLARLAQTEAAGDRVELVLAGDGPARSELEARAARLGVADRIHWLGYVADRGTYLDALAAADLFVFPSPAEGFPKVILDAMAAGLPVLARPSGELRSIRDLGLIQVPAEPGVEALVAAIVSLRRAPTVATELRSRGRDFVAGHTRDGEAARLVERWRQLWPRLPWSASS